MTGAYDGEATGRVGETGGAVGIEGTGGTEGGPVTEDPGGAPATEGPVRAGVQGGGWGESRGWDEGGG
jgi:hypothetical protein